MLCTIIAYWSDKRLVQDKKTTEVVCYSVAMYDIFKLVVEDGKYAKIYEFSHNMHP
jgi:hypothetical protein